MEQKSNDIPYQKGSFQNVHKSHNSLVKRYGEERDLLCVTNLSVNSSSICYKLLTNLRIEKNVFSKFVISELVLD